MKIKKISIYSAINLILSIILFIFIIFNMWTQDIINIVFNGQSYLYILSIVIFSIISIILFYIFNMQNYYVVGEKEIIHKRKLITDKTIIKKYNTEELTLTKYKSMFMFLFKISKIKIYSSSILIFTSIVKDNELDVFYTLLYGKDTLVKQPYKKENIYLNSQKLIANKLIRTFIISTFIYINIYLILNILKIININIENKYFYSLIILFILIIAYLVICLFGNDRSNVKFKNKYIEITKGLLFQTNIKLGYKNKLKIRYNNDIFSLKMNLHNVFIILNERIIFFSASKETIILLSNYDDRNKVNIKNSSFYILSIISIILLIITTIFKLHLLHILIFDLFIFIQSFINIKQDSNNNSIIKTKGYLFKHTYIN